MSIRLNASRGSYNVQASEMLQGYKPSSKLSRCRVRFLDDSEGNFEIDRNAKGHVLLHLVFDHLELIEKDYFGLQFQDASSKSRDMIWLDALKPVKKQIKGSPPYILFLKVKFYVSDPSKLKEEYTRYHFFLEIRKDIAEGRFVVPRTDAVVLASYVVQSELGDFNPEEHGGGYLSVFHFVPGQTHDFENEVSAMHQQHRMQTPADAEYNFLAHAKKQEMYGVELHSARFKDKSAREVQLGVTYAGLALFQNSARTNIYNWTQVIRVTFKRKLFTIKLRKEQSLETGDDSIVFKMETSRACKSLWKSCVEHHTFFHLHSPPQPRNNLFSLQSKFRYSGRTEYETMEEIGKRARIARTFTRSASERYARRTVGPVFHSVHTDNRRQLVEYHGARTTVGRGVAVDRLNVVSSRSSTSRLPFVSNSHPSMPNSASFRGSLSPSVDSVVRRNRVGTTLAVHRTGSYGSLYRRGLTRTIIPPSQISRTDYRLSTVEPRLVRNFESGSNNWGSRPKVNGAVDRLQERNDVGLSNGFPSQDSKEHFLFPIVARTRTYRSDDSIPVDLHSPDLSPVSGGVGNVVVIRMKPDAQGHFGFNVKGGADKNLPVIISRVVPNTPADLCIPRLNEGDQVLLINGRDVSSYSHDQVIQCILSSREAFDLVLVVRPNVYIPDDVFDEPVFKDVPENHLSTLAPPCREGDALLHSLALLQEELSSGSALARFEKLYQRKPGTTTNAAMLTDNLAKNRYRDISPYDQTRVKVKEGTTNDYINANFVNMEIPVSGIVNRYIAAQGPLPSTVVDFWMMVWEQRSSLIVMLTALTERGRAKCHPYWPDQYDAVKHGRLIVTGHRETLTNSIAYRELTLRRADKSGEERTIYQMQYMAWPDQSVPGDCSDFLDFVLRVHQSRTGMVEPTLVHCSAGIGRTGALIALETAICLIEANQPVYPLDIVRQMRDQRPMLIQTSGQYRFVCEAILRIYKDKIVCPSDDYN